MNRTNNSLNWSPLAALCTLAICVSAQAQSYRLTEIGARADQTASLPSGINNAAEIAGTSGNFAFRAANGVKEILGSLPNGTLSRGFGINNLGDVVGDSTVSARTVVTHATLFTQGQAYDLGTLRKFGEFSIARGVNDSREVVGYVGPASPSEFTRAFIWDKDNAMRNLGTLGGDFSQAFSISNTSYVTGNAQLTSGSPVRHAFLWHPNLRETRDLGTLGGASSYGTFVNDSGHVVGYSELNGRVASDTRVHAFLYDGSTMRDLGSLGSRTNETDRSAALGINANDEVVGTTYGDSSGRQIVQVAFLYKNGAMYDLNTLVDASLGAYHLQSATGINDEGEIVAQAMDRKTNTVRAVLLTPSITR